MQRDDLTQKIVDTLDQRAAQINTTAIADGVMQRIRHKRHHHANRVGIGLALAAAISGVSVLPHLTAHQANKANDAQHAKLSPQLADDLDMLMVLGEDTVHGS